MQKGREVSRAPVFGKILAVSSRCWGHSDRLGQLEIEHRFRWQLDFLAFGHALDSGSSSRSSARSDRGSLAATGDRADHGTQSSASADGRCCAFTASSPHFLPLVGNDVVTLAVDIEHRHLERELRLSSEVR